MVAWLALAVALLALTAEGFLVAACFVILRKVRKHGLVGLMQPRINAKMSPMSPIESGSLERG